MSKRDWPHDNSDFIIHDHAELMRLAILCDETSVAGLDAQDKLRRHRKAERAMAQTESVLKDYVSGRKS
jgi:hypothetical protein